tara:strand:- start:485 stop:1090 length:606 start_codon:yes stop_codon:yes gene_type:complete
MCDATTMFVMGSAMSAGQSISARKAARAQSKASRRAYELGSERAIAAFSRQTLQSQERQQQEEEKIANEINAIVQERISRQSTLETSAGESGVAGQTLELLLQDFERQETEYRINASRSFDYFSDNMADQLEEVRLGTRDRIENMAAQIKPRPSSLTTALQIGGGVLNAYSQSGLAQENALAAALEAGQTAVVSTQGQGEE